MREVRSQALSQAEVAAATASGQLGQPAELRRIVGTIAQSSRGRVIITDARGRLVADSDGPAQLGGDYSEPPGDRRRAARPPLPGPSGAPTRSTRRSSPPPCRSSPPARPEGAVRITQSVEAVGRATRTSISASSRSAASCCCSASAPAR